MLTLNLIEPGHAVSVNRLPRRTCGSFHRGTATAHGPSTRIRRISTMAYRVPFIFQIAGHLARVKKPCQRPAAKRRPLEDVQSGAPLRARRWREKRRSTRENEKKKRNFLELARCVFVCQRALALAWLGERAMSSTSRASAPPQASPPSPLLRRRAEHLAPDSWPCRAASEPSSWVEWCPSCSAEDTGPTKPVSARRTFLSPFQLGTGSRAPGLDCHRLRMSASHPVSRPGKLILGTSCRQPFGAFDPMPFRGVPIF